ncbi:hypothetical protein, partial [Rhodovulum sulfidophilum]|uniref:hypothetical protein n=1 Tax=Rhodovulum sulfidophilum TaxID=35806 RepID=UPI001F1A7E92
MRDTNLEDGASVGQGQDKDALRRQSGGPRSACAPAPTLAHFHHSFSNGLLCMALAFRPVATPRRKRPR